MLSIDSLLFNKKTEFRFKQLKFKVVRFAMDKIRENALVTMEDNFVSKGDNCNCWDRLRYLLPCPCILSRYSGEIPLSIIHHRWLIDEDECR